MEKSRATARLDLPHSHCFEARPRLLGNEECPHYFSAVSRACDSEYTLLGSIIPFFGFTTFA